MKDYKFFQQKYLVQTYVNRGLTFLKAKGVSLYDVQNKKYLDMMSNYGVNIFGHNHPKITKTIMAQLKRIVDLHCSFNNDVRAEASEKLINKCGEYYSQIYWSNSGTEANEAALKFAVLATGKKKFIYCDHSYHGKTLGALSVTGGKKYRDPFEPLIWQTIQIAYNDLQALEKKIDKDTAAFIVEPIQGESGIIPGAPGYLKKVREICDKKGVLLIFDEIQTGTGRTGKFLASHWEGVNADILCLGKGLAGGLPVGATIVNSKVGSKITKAMHTCTFGGNPLVCAGTLAILELLNEPLLKHILEISKYFIASLKKIKSDLIVDIRGKGLMIGIEVKGKRNDILKKLQENFVLAIPAGDNVVRFLPPYIVKEKDVDFTVEKLSKVLKTL